MDEADSPPEGHDLHGVLADVKVKDGSGVRYYVAERAVCLDDRARSPGEKARLPPATSASVTSGSMEMNWIWVLLPTLTHVPLGAVSSDLPSVPDKGHLRLRKGRL